MLGQSFTVAAWRPSPAARRPLEPRLRALVRRELLSLDADPRSPERGQYAFVQALIREVAYNTLAKTDRKVAPPRRGALLRGARDRRAGRRLAGHYLAAQRLAARDAEADALAAQARIALRGAAERAAALGSHEQAGTFLEQALDVTTDPADRADLHERAYHASVNVLDQEPLLRHAAAAEEERRKTGDREAIAIAATLRAQSLTTARNDPAAALAMVEQLWEEFSDLEQTQAGGRAHARLHASLSRPRPTPIARWSGRTASCPSPSGWATCRRSPAASRAEDQPHLVAGRPNEGIILLRGAHQLALANDLDEVELSSRVLLSFYEQWGDPTAGLALGREGLEIGRHRGSRAYSFQMVGNSAICALRVGEWDWAGALLDDWLEVAGEDNRWIEFRVDRALLHAHRGLDATADIEAAARSRAGVTDPQFESYELFARAAAALVSGDLRAAIEHAERSATITDYFHPLAVPLAARAALWAGDGETAKRLLDKPAMASFSGPALAADLTRIRAGIAAVEGRRPEALAGFIEALRLYEELGLRFDGAAAAVDMAVLLPGIEAESAAAAEGIAAARGTLEHLGARPYIERLDTASTAPAQVSLTAHGGPAASSPPERSDLSVPSQA